VNEVLSIQNLHKSFGAAKVLQGISLGVPAGSVYGFLGENGAGKTTTMKIILGLLQGDRGQIHVCGEKVRFGHTTTNRFLGYLPDVPQFYPYMRGREYLKFSGEAAGLSHSQIHQRSGELLELVGLGTVKKKIGAYSRGMKQRLGMAQALIHQPAVLICDEPTSALDPTGRQEILDILRAIRATTTVIFSTHILGDVERICDRAAVLHQGRIVLEGSLGDLKARQGSQGLRLEFASREDLTRFCERVLDEFIELISQTSVIVRTTDIRQEHQVIGMLADAKIVPLSLEAISPTIESLFLEAVR
jgi:ABC-2 type transport system ATP-binding protein